MIEIYTDGSAKKDGKGGYGICVIKYNNSLTSNFLIAYTFNEVSENTTNNREELKAILKALSLTQSKQYKNETCIIKSDSAYCVNMFNEWIDKWYYNNWTRTGNKEIENLDLVKKIYKFKKINMPNFRIDKVKGHNNVIGNEIADALSKNDKIKLDKILKENDNIYPHCLKFD